MTIFKSGDRWEAEQDGVKANGPKQTQEEKKKKDYCSNTFQMIEG